MIRHVSFVVSLILVSVVVVAEEIFDVVGDEAGEFIARLRSQTCFKQVFCRQTPNSFGVIHRRRRGRRPCGI